VTEPERIEAALGRLPVLGALPPDSEPVPELSAVVRQAEEDGRLALEFLARRFPESWSASKDLRDVEHEPGSPEDRMHALLDSTADPFGD